MSDITIDGKKKSFKEKFKEEFIEYWINVAYLTFYFGVFVTYKRLILAQYEIDFEEYGTAFFNAFVLGKVVSIIGMTKMGKKNINTNLSVSTLYKTAVFTLCLVVFNALEEFVVGYFKTSSAQEAIVILSHHLGTHEYLASLLVVFTSFIPFFAFKELARVIGHKTIIDLFFKRKEADL
ncbi:hypothetical protein FNW21_00160 [Flavobacterium restrictum]|uniref:Uncharacterized protein n=2 Tax=Flavobacterium restrictum TaxID=2594428 RepID=A0A553ECL0_9FLAO|nr:hypothetical protein FNW21_00160 [Flavobacterium restrictum]